MMTLQLLLRRGRVLNLLVSELVCLVGVLIRSMVVSLLFSSFALKALLL